MPGTLPSSLLARCGLVRRVALAALAGGVLVAGCGGSAATSTTAHVGAAGTAAATPTAAATTSVGASSRGAISSTPAGQAGSFVAYASCMRANGVSDFPDPSPGGGARFQVPAQVQASPAFKTAQAKCQHILAASGGGLPGSGPPATAQTMAKLVRIARCMRQHGISEFPDPQASMPSHPPADVREITDFDGAILLFPVTLNMEAPAYRQDLTACGAPPLGLPH